MTVDDETLLARAKAVRLAAHAPYSKYLVGVAVLDGNGDIHVGCNVENVSYPEGICAESNAIGSMVAAGGKKIVSIVVVGGVRDLEACTPCGGCRQRILEFSDEHTRVLFLDGGGRMRASSIREMLPAPFSPP
ncbi:MAG: cytidine deaminase [Gammaproteobacteria bacterium]|nr:cytidine deaminase [Gammaproteobacteria bacterium]